MNSVWLVLTLLAAEEQVRPFAIEVVDEATGRGVPLVELTTTSGITFVTDSAGLIAFDEPGLLDQRVHFSVQSHGYEFRQDGFGFRGIALDLKPGGSATIKIKRLNIAERLYRMTGQGIYRDSVLLGRQPPIKQPLLNAKVTGSDSVQNAIFRGQLYWFWGDTNWPAYPLGLFHMAGATSDLPESGGLAPSVGINLAYFSGDNGFARPTAKMPGEGPTWLDGLTVLRDVDGRERMFAAYVKIRPPLTTYRRGICEWNADQQVFEQVIDYEPDQPRFPFGHPILRDGYVCFGDPFPRWRVRAAPEDYLNLARYEDSPADVRLRDAVTDKPVRAHRGSVNWNEYRKKWIAIFVEQGGSSPLGEVWYAEAVAPEGPWTKCTKIVTHDKYSFYNPKQHPYFDEAGGRTIYFEGTYTHTFSGNPQQTPRYDYNQIMYRLDLADERLQFTH